MGAAAVLPVVSSYQQDMNVILVTLVLLCSVDSVAMVVIPFLRAENPNAW